MSNLDLERLESEIRAQRTKTMNAIVNRRDHPSYGYTKGTVRTEAARLEGMLMAWLYVTKRWDSPGTIFWTAGLREIALNKFAIDWVAIDSALSN